MKKFSVKDWIITTLFVIGLALMVISLYRLTNGFNTKLTTEVPKNYWGVLFIFGLAVACMIAGVLGIMFNEANKKDDD